MLSGKAACVFAPFMPQPMPEGVVDLPLEEVDVPVAGNLYAGVAEQLRDEDSLEAQRDFVPE